MKHELIELYRAVQRFRGDWRAPDRCWHGDEGVGTIWEIVSNRTTSIQFDTGILGIDFHLDSLLWLPPVYSDDGRCLVGMIPGAVEIFRTDLGEWGVNRWSGEEMYFSGYCETLPEALLRAIAAKGDVT